MRGTPLVSARPPSAMTQPMEHSPPSPVVVDGSAAPQPIHSHAHVSQWMEHEPEIIMPIVYYYHNKHTRIAIFSKACHKLHKTNHRLVTRKCSLSYTLMQHGIVLFHYKISMISNFNTTMVPSLSKSIADVIVYHQIRDALYRKIKWCSCKWWFVETWNIHISARSTWKLDYEILIQRHI